MRFLEITAFIALSGALHAATLAVVPVLPGGSSGGQSGASEVTLYAASPTLAALVQDWNRAPDISDAPVLAQPSTAQIPDRPAPDHPVADAPRVATLPDPAPPPAQPRVETRLPAPPEPLAQTAPGGLSAPDLPAVTPPPVPAAESVQRLVAPSLDAVSPDAGAPPQVDTASAASPIAPTASLRPEPRPAVRAAQNPARREQAAPQPAQKAKGTDGKPATATAPARAAPLATGPSTAQLVQLEQQWGARITSALRRAHRPPRGVRGSVQLVISITPAGQVAGVSVAESSGDSRLDQSALAAVKRARFPRAPEGLTKSAYRFSQRLTVAR
jgi:protein TonB